MINIWEFGTTEYEINSEIYNLVIVIAKSCYNKRGNAVGGYYYESDSPLFNINIREIINHLY